MVQQQTKSPSQHVPSTAEHQNRYRGKAKQGQGRAGGGGGRGGGQGRTERSRAGQGAYMVKGMAQLGALGLVHSLEAVSEGHVSWLLVALVGSAVLVLASEVLMHRNGVLYPLQQA